VRVALLAACWQHPLPLLFVHHRHHHNTTPPQEAGYCCRGSDGCNAVMGLNGATQDGLWAAANSGDGAAVARVTGPLRLLPTQVSGVNRVCGWCGGVCSHATASPVREPRLPPCCAVLCCAVLCCAVLCCGGRSGRAAAAPLCPCGCTYGSTRQQAQKQVSTQAG
jgi:hypothetical protein